MDLGGNTSRINTFSTNYTSLLSQEECAMWEQIVGTVELLVMR